jgi:hypothetical protein
MPEVLLWRVSRHASGSDRPGLYARRAGPLLCLRLDPLSRNSY